MRKAIKVQNLIENEEDERRRANKYDFLRECADWVSQRCAGGCEEIITKDDIKTIAEMHLRKKYKGGGFLDTIEFYRLHDHLEPACADCIEDYIYRETWQEDSDLTLDDESD